ncbi:Choline-sulfatase [Stieleria maiorica]|uniref:Choline-sulfatase n=1 Tax=Stieleria maiorica TaxID=2795974 RepID=A0A5B9MF64_9BACT|nr:sulfatase-like hydrolase/transferase [Stieleria maiorica]QEF98640.1 Choline-sulfatase [Stieleria maiorica]
MLHRSLISTLCLVAVLSLGVPVPVRAAPPNVLFIAVDDLNDWIGCMGGHPQAATPNLDRLAEVSMLFTNSHCPAPACNPSRTAIMTGISPHVSGLYDNRQKMRELLPDAELLPKYFSRHGYWSAGSGKLLHYFIDQQSWDQYYPPKETEDPFPRTLYPEKRPVSLPVGGPWQYRETDWGPLDVTDEEFGGDYLVSKWVGEQLGKQHDKPFFLACGIYRPHEPWFVPKKYFDQFPLDDIQLPPGYREDDLDDLPPEGKRRGPNRYFGHILKHGQWKQGVQGYLTSIAFADAMVGRVIDALERGPNRDNTIVVLWSDHGWHLGEKQHWQKYTAWRACTRVPLMIRVPPGTTGLTAGTPPNTICDAPVNLLSLYPTLTELAGLPPKESNHGPSLLPLLENPAAEWPHVSITYLNRPGNYGLSERRWRFIQYDNGDHELYDTRNDRYEWNNLASEPEHAARIARMRASAPAEFAEYVAPSDEALQKLAWHAATESGAPPSKPDGNRFDVVFTNRRDQPVKVFWMDRRGTPKSFGTLESGWRKPLQTRPGAVWLITDTNEHPLGYFVVGDRTAHAVIDAE